MTRPKWNAWVLSTKALAAEIIEVAAGLVFRRGNLLITQRPAEAHLGGLWEFPGGKREPGETLEQCLQRELNEELGIEVEVGDLLESLTHVYPEKTVCLNFYLCQLSKGEPEPIGCSSLKWVRPNQLRDFEFPPADERILERLLADAKLWE